VVKNRYGTNSQTIRQSGRNSYGVYDRRGSYSGSIHVKVIRFTRPISMEHGSNLRSK